MEKDAQPVHAHVRVMRMYKAATIATGTYLVEAKATY